MWRLGRRAGCIARIARLAVAGWSIQVIECGSAAGCMLTTRAMLILRLTLLLARIATLLAAGRLGLLLRLLLWRLLRLLRLLVRRTLLQVFLLVLHLVRLLARLTLVVSHVILLMMCEHSSYA